MNWFVRQIASSSKPTIEVIVKGDQWTLNTYNIKTVKVQFKLDEEVTLDLMGKTRKVRFFIMILELQKVHKKLNSLIFKHILRYQIHFATSTNLLS